MKTPEQLIKDYLLKGRLIERIKNDYLISKEDLIRLIKEAQGNK